FTSGHRDGRRLGRYLADGGHHGAMAVPTSAPSHRAYGRLRPHHPGPEELAAVPGCGGDRRRTRRARTRVQRLAWESARIARTAAALHRRRLAPIADAANGTARLGRSRPEARPLPGGIPARSRSGAAPRPATAPHRRIAALPGPGRIGSPARFRTDRSERLVPRPHRIVERS